MAGAEVKGLVRGVLNKDHRQFSKCPPHDLRGVLLCQDLRVWPQLNQAKTTANGDVENGRAAVRRVPRAQDMEVLGQGETPAKRRTKIEGQTDAAGPLAPERPFEQIKGFAEDLGEIRAVNLVNEQEKRPVWLS